MSSNTIHLDLAKLPVHEKDGVCMILEQDNAWEKLGRLMQFSEIDIANFKTEADRLGRKTSDILITRWSTRYAHNVTELFKLLSLMQKFDAMEVIKNQVHPKYHVWFTPTEVKSDEKPMNMQSRLFNEVKQPERKDEFKESLKDLNIPKIDIQELIEATNNWSVKHFLGRGGFGIVYQGNWMCTDVAIKKLEYRESRSGPSKAHLIQSLNELRYLNKCRHDNILPIYGYALTDDICYVVYQLMSGGSLEDRLAKKNQAKALTWPDRWNIAKGTARGLQYLHNYNKTKPLIHGDIKPANILLDSVCTPKIGDFGLSREGSHDYETLNLVFGTKPYLPQEFLSKKLFSVKVDVFSFGVVLFQIATGLKAADKNRKQEMLYDEMAKLDADNIEVIRAKIDNSTPNDPACLDLCQLMILIGKRCTCPNPNDRPEMVPVFKDLENFKPIVIVAQLVNYDGKPAA